LSFLTTYNDAARSTKPRSAAAAAVAAQYDSFVLQQQTPKEGRNGVGQVLRLHALNVGIGRGRKGAAWKKDLITAFSPPAADGNN
jgi:hypothetical protein